MKKLFKVLSVIFVLLYSTSAIASPINLYDTDHNSEFNTDDTCWELNPGLMHMGTVSTSYCVITTSGNIVNCDDAVNNAEEAWGHLVSLTKSSGSNNCIYQNSNSQYPFVKLNRLDINESTGHVSVWQFGIDKTVFSALDATSQANMIAHGIGLVYGLDKVTLSDADVMKDSSTWVNAPNYLERWGMRVVTHQHRHDVSSWEPFECEKLTSGNSSYNSKHRAFCSSCWTTCLENHTFSYTYATATKHLKSCSPCGYSLLTAHVAMTVNGNTVCRYCGCPMSGGGGIII